MKILINRKPVKGPWGGGNNFIRAIHEFASKHGFITTNILEHDIDLIFMIDPRYDDLKISINEIAKYKQYKPSTKVVYRINECDARKGLQRDIDPVIKASSHISDMCIFISNWIMNYHVDSEWKCKHNHVIYSGTNKNHFRPNKKIENGKINIVTHHWSDNLLKGHDVYQKIDNWLSKNDQFTFTYIGRSHGNLDRSTIVPPTFGQDLGDKLSSYDVYISASRFDPGPNHIIESLACEIPTYAHSDSGGAVEMVGESHVYSSFDQLVRILESRDYKKNDGIYPDDWETCINKYFSKINEIL
jgi:hypothetical protein